MSSMEPMDDKADLWDVLNEELSENTLFDNLIDPFIGFSPPQSPGTTEAHYKAKVLEFEIQRLNEIEDERGIDWAEIKVEKTQEEILEPVSLAEQDLTTTENEDQQEDPAAVDQKIVERQQQRSSRGSSPADSVSSRGSFHRSVSVSSRDSKGSQKSLLNDASSGAKLPLPFEDGPLHDVVIKDTNSEVPNIHPTGLKLKRLQEVSEHSTDGLSGEDVSIPPEPYTVPGDGETMRREANTSSIRKSGRVITPSSNYKIVEMREESRKRTGSDSPMAPPTKRGKIVLKINRSSIEKSSESNGTGKKDTSQFGLADVSVPHHHPEAPKGPLRKITGQVEERPSRQKNGKAQPKKRRHIRRILDGRSRKTSENSWGDDKSTGEKPRIVCSLDCTKAMGLVPDLQCSKCFCLYHAECADLSPNICMSCKDNPGVKKPSKMETAIAPAPPTGAPPMPALPPAPLQVPTVPQCLVSVNRRRFIMVPDLSSPLAVTPAASTRTVSQQPLTADLPTSAVNSSVSKPEGAATKLIVKEAERASRLMSDMCLTYSTLLLAFRHLPTKDVLQASLVCRLWKEVAYHESLWRVVHGKDVFVKDWESFCRFLSERKTRRLELCNMPVNVNCESFQYIPLIKTLESLSVDKITPSILSRILRFSPSLKFCTAHLDPDGMVSDSLKLEGFSEFQNMEELHIDSAPNALVPIQAFDVSAIAATLNSLYLNSLTAWRDTELHGFNKLVNLTDLELGECSTLPQNCPDLFQSLTKLRRIRLERMTEPCPVTPILHALSTLPYLEEVELINVDVRLGFDAALGSMTNMKMLFLTPTCVTHSATTTSLVLQGVYQLRASLLKFTWIFTEELVTITEIFIDHVGATRRGSNSVPILAPIPAPEIKDNNKELWSELSQRECDLPTSVAIVLLEEVLKMLKAALPSTETKILILPYQNTLCRI